MKALRDLQEVHSNKHIQLTENPAGLVMQRCNDSLHQVVAVPWAHFEHAFLGEADCVVDLWGASTCPREKPCGE